VRDVPGVLFETELLIVRPWTDDDAEHVFAIYRDPEVWRYLGGGKALEDLEGARAMLRRWIAESEEAAPCGAWAVIDRATATPIGTVMLWPLEEGPEIEVGYHFARSSWGKGYATEAAPGTITHGFRVLVLDQLVAVVFPENPASQRVLQKAGMIYRGMRQTFGFDLMYYTIDRPTDLQHAGMSA